MLCTPQHKLSAASLLQSIISRSDSHLQTSLVHSLPKWHTLLAAFFTGPPLAVAVVVAVAVAAAAAVVLAAAVGVPAAVGVFALLLLLPTPPVLCSYM